MYVFICAFSSLGLFGFFCAPGYLSKSSSISCEGLATTASPRHGTHAVAASAERSERHGSYVDEGEGTGLTEDTVKRNRGGGAEVTSDDDGDDDVDDVSLLRELTRQQEEDLRMAAMIGQKLLDTQEELHAELEVSTTVLLSPRGYVGSCYSFLLLS